MTLLPNVLRRATRWGSRAAGVSCLFITMAAGAQGCVWIDNFVGCSQPNPNNMVHGPNGPVRALTTFGTALIVGGQFSAVGDDANCSGPPYPPTPTYCIAGWTGSAWFPLGVGMDNSVLALTTFDDDGDGPHATALYAGGLFTSASGVTASHIAKWNGTTWSPLGAGLNGEVYSLTTFDDDGAGPHLPALYAGGAFTKAGGTTVNYIAKWNGTAWSNVASGMDGTVRALTTFNGALYAGGAFTKVGNANKFNRIAKWNGTAWSKLGTGVDNISTVFALTSFNGGLIVGGQFATTGGGVVTPGIARWDGANWSALGNGMNNTVMSLATYTDGWGTALYAGGYFTAASNVPHTANIARWSAGTSTWSALDQGMMGRAGESVYALNTFGIHLYAGGYCQVAPAPPGDGYFGEWSGCQ